ncbi:hypothetical protein IFR05_005168 [Cadophora sp. M221]|nr:hypothetical protein IFR05_005168 [Cadophora sp. M221]
MSIENRPPWVGHSEVANSTVDEDLSEELPTKTGSNLFETALGNQIQDALEDPNINDPNTNDSATVLRRLETLERQYNTNQRSHYPTQEPRQTSHH